jgi:exopolysaccharide biosynthesis polyprenyl glycosylphosphotransferase
MKPSTLALIILRIPFDYALLLLAGVVSFWLRFSDAIVLWRPVLFRVTFAEYMQSVWWIAAIFLILLAINGQYAYNPNRKFVRDVGRIGTACLMGLGCVAMALLLRQQVIDSRFLLIVGTATAWVFLSLGRLVFQLFQIILYKWNIGHRQVAIIGDTTAAKELALLFEQKPQLGYRVVCTAPTFTKQTKKQLHLLDIDELILTNPSRDDAALAAIEYCAEKQIVFKYSADLFSAYLTNTVTYPLGGVPIVEVRRTGIGVWGRIIKRIFDLVVASCLLLFFLPVYVVTAIGVLIDSGRPVIFKNERVGYKRRTFFLYKFRSMYQKDCTGPQFGKAGKDAEVREQELIQQQNGRSGPIYKVINDPRVTRFGVFLRKTSLDELPQLVNVIKGEMSLVGPRPHQPREVAGYAREHRVSFEVKPGITGLAQISGRSDLSYEDELRLDVYYIERWSLVLDFVILIKTPFLLLKPRKTL